MSKLNQEKLLEKLEEFRNCKITYSKILYTKEDEQLYQEMRKRVQKPQVTEEWIEEKATELFAKHSIGFPTPKMIEILKDFIQSFASK